ncbi:M20/M25/M40 family metallo-hydrolase [Solimonas marina]|uniref:M20/M25/M40 family metallo-hydrolase n=1 Tax=Solimonas marina TaxID=2714601 RepID=A0A970B6F8_9GAMM|nr:M20/M25/M40 family metallo-hydrolase [Solimonas marina]NKF24427.1 M20/M25/M40 family metallo-hydrolase [Solimonas marina]
MKSKTWKFLGLTSVLFVGLGLAACGKTPSDSEQKGEEPAAQAAAPAKPKLGIRPYGDETVKIDMSQIHNPDLKKIYQYIDDHIDDHVVNLQKWIQQPSISNTGEGIQESAEMVKGFWDQLGCQQTQVYDVGKTEWGAQGNPVVYAKCDEGAKKTLVVYWMYDTMPISQPDLWKSPPFEARLVEQPPYKKVLIGRGAVNSKGPEMTQWNALMSIKAVTGKLPVNLIIVAEGDEERMDIGYRQFVKTHPDLFKGADAMYPFSFQGYVLSGSEGCVYVELTTSGKKWGRGPTYSNIHGAHKREVDSPAWRHIQMLSTLVSKDGNTVKIPGFYDNIVPLNDMQKAKIKAISSKADLKKMAENLGVARFIKDDPEDVLKMMFYGTSFNLDGIWGGNMFPGGSGAILPNEITSKHNIRYVPNQNGIDIVDKLRKYLDSEGYSDVGIHIVGDVPWAKQSTDNDIAKAGFKMMDSFGIPHAAPSSAADIIGGYWPAYLFSGDPVNLPIAGTMAGTGGGAHAANEYFVIEGAGKTYGMAGAEKSVATVLYDYAGLNDPAAGEASK